jgi:hypothetical protein
MRFARPMRCTPAWLRYGVEEPTGASAEAVLLMDRLTLQDRDALLSLIHSLNCQRQAG